MGSSPTRGSSFFLGKVTALGVLCCFALFVCLTLLASFFLPSHLSFKNMYMYSSCVYMTLYYLDYSVHMWSKMVTLLRIVRVGLTHRQRTPAVHTHRPCVSLTHWLLGEFVSSSSPSFRACRVC